MLRAAWHGIRDLFFRKRSQKELHEEVDAYFEAAVREKIAAGVGEKDARRLVRLENGTCDFVVEQAQAVRWEAAIDATWRDLSYGWRVLRKNPGVAVIAVLTLALGMGSTTAVFSVVRGVLLRPFPFPQQDRLLMLWQKGEDGKRSNVGFATMADWKRMNHSFSGMSAVSFWTPTLVSASAPENLTGFRLSAGTFEMLGVRMAAGRDFLSDEDAQGHNTVVVLSNSLWRRRFGSDPQIIGKPVQLGSKMFTVVGVLPANFPPIFSFDPRKSGDVYAPLAYDISLAYACRTCQHLRVIGRLRDGVTNGQALAEMNQISDGLFQSYRTEYSNPGVMFTGLREYIVGDVRPVLMVLLGAVGFVLLIACVNVSNLLLSSAVKRRREFALRMALGARSARLVRQLLMESLLLSLMGGALGVGFAQVTLWLLPKLGLTSLPRLHDIRLDGSVFLFTLFVCVATSIFFGILPAFQARKAEPAEALNEGMRSTATASRTKLRNALITCDVAISLVLLVGAGLLAKSFLRLVKTDPGFNAKNVLTLSVSLWGQKYATDEAAVTFYQETLRRIDALPGVESAALTSQLPLGGNVDRYGMHIADKPNPNPESDPSADRYSVSSEYFRTLRIPIQRGRVFNDNDRAGTAHVAVINETFAKSIWPGEDALGKQIRIGDIKSAPRTVIGIVGDVLHTGLDAPHTMQIYLPNTQFTDSDVTMVVRTRNSDPAALAGEVRRAIASVDPLQPISNVLAMPEVVATSAARQRFSALLFAGFAFSGLLMAAVGIYGVIAYAVVQRTQEIGIRVAMGAQRRDVLTMIVEQGMQPAMLGTVLGAGIALVVTQPLTSLLFNVNPHDSYTILSMIAVVMLVALLACYLPARRATGIDPMTALRSE